MFGPHGSPRGVTRSGLLVHMADSKHLEDFVAGKPVTSYCSQQIMEIHAARSLYAKPCMQFKFANRNLDDHAVMECGTCLHYDERLGPLRNAKPKTRRQKARDRDRAREVLGRIAAELAWKPGEDEEFAHLEHDMLARVIAEAAAEHLAARLRRSGGPAVGVVVGELARDVASAVRGFYERPTGTIIVPEAGLWGMFFAAKADGEDIGAHTMIWNFEHATEVSIDTMIRKLNRPPTS